MLMGMVPLSTKAAAWVNKARCQLFPAACLFCRAPLTDADGCCPACLAGIRPHTRSACGLCGVAMPESLAPGPCGRCLRRPPAQVATHSLYRYRDGVRDALLAWKLQGDDAGLHWLLQASAVRIRELVGPDDLLLPVPMPRARMRKAGQHHAADLCRQMAVIAGCDWDWRILRRRGEQPRQSELSGAARMRNLRRAFISDMSRWPGDRKGRLWLVDDIITTGATVHHAARALKPLAMPVQVLSLARTPPKG